MGGATLLGQREVLLVAPEGGGGDEMMEKRDWVEQGEGRR